MPFNLKKINIESLYLFIVFGILIYLGLASMWSNKLSHGYPQGYAANDAFYKYSRMHQLVETGNFKYHEWWVYDGRKDLYQHENPFASFSSAILTTNSGLPDYDAWTFMGILIKIMAVFIMYIIIRKFDKYVAFASLGIAGFIFVGNAFISFRYGWIPLSIATSLLFFLLWILVHLDFKGMWIMLGLCISAVMLTHMPEFYYAILITLIFFIYLFFEQKFKFSVFKKPLLAILIFLPLSLYFIPATYLTTTAIIKGGAITAHVDKATFPLVSLNNFGLFKILIVLGVLAFIIYCVFNRDKIKYFLPLIVLFILSLTYYVGFSDRFMQLSYFWAVLFMVFVGMAIYMIIFIPQIKKIDKSYLGIGFMVISILLLICTLKYYYEPPNHYGVVVNQDMWDGILWIRENIPDNSRTLIGYGDTYSQHGVYLMFEKVLFEIKDDDYMAKLVSGNVTKTYNIRQFIHNYDFLFVRHGMLNFEPIRLGKPEWEITRGWEETDICSFDYYITDKVSMYPQIIDYNQKFVNTLYSSGNFEKVFENKWYFIMKNNKPGEPCVN